MVSGTCLRLVELVRLSQTCLVHKEQKYILYDCYFHLKDFSRLQRFCWTTVWNKLCLQLRKSINIPRSRQRRWAFCRNSTRKRADWCTMTQVSCKVVFGFRSPFFSTQKKKKKNMKGSCSATMRNQFLSRLQSLRMIWSFKMQKMDLTQVKTRSINEKE